MNALAAHVKHSKETQGYINTFVVIYIPQVIRYCCNIVEVTFDHVRHTNLN